ncbi:hypothetical protein CK203_099201 [Vitis vinifera]|uniref:Uncharacterized protein n=1 Tax=Vitis vinifera TaxID=29760 RepID=A0A438DMQ5_VITVI|nr:hypothetical protein CK203_099201 [Vitis vinifera]
MLFKKFYKVVVDLVSMNQLKMIEATTEVWTTYTKEHLSLDTKPIRNYDKLFILLGKDRATGSLAVDASVSAPKSNKETKKRKQKDQLFEEIAKIGGMSDVSHMKAYQALTGDVSTARAFLACPIDRRSSFALTTITLSSSPHSPEFVALKLCGMMKEQFHDVASFPKGCMFQTTNQAQACVSGLAMVDGFLYTVASTRDLGFVQELLERDPLLVFGEGEYGVTDILYAVASRKNCEVFRLVFYFVVPPRFSTSKDGEMEEQIGEIPSVFKWEMINRVVSCYFQRGKFGDFEGPP